MSDYLPWTVEHMAAEEMQQDWSDLRFQSVFHDAYKSGGNYVKHYADKRIAELESQLAAIKSELEALREQHKLALYALHESQDWDWLTVKESELINGRLAFDEMQELWDIKVSLSHPTTQAKD